MTGLRELFEELAESPPAPGPLAADELYAAGRRSRQRRRAVWAATATVAVGAIAAGVVGLVGGATPDRSAPGEDAAGPSAPAPAPAVGLPRGGVQWVGAADATHLYRAVAACPEPSASCPKTRWRLSASTDGGRTWTERGPAIEVVGLTVLDRLTLAGADWRSATSDAVLTVDGGRTWSRVDAGATVATATVVTTICGSADTGPTCQLYGLDPAGRFGRLVHQPALAITDAELVAGDRLWVGGQDPRSRRPMAAVSADRGGTWSVHTFAGFPACADVECYRVEVSTGDGGTAYAMVTDLRSRREAVYRGTPDGRWRLVRDGTSPPEVVSSERSFVTRDGAHVVSRYEDVADRDTDRRRFWAAPPGTGEYRPLRLDGLPDAVRAVRRAPDGWLYTYLDDGTVYGSVDGRRWAPTTD
jgi:hypothetical protein